MVGTDRYTDALAYLRDVHNAGDLTVDQQLAAAQVSATLALAAATALNVVAPFVGDSPEITDWARLVAPDAVNGKSRPIPEHNWPEHWPPQIGDVWEDRKEDNWLMESNGVLVRLSGGADDKPEEIHRTYGPLKLVRRPTHTNRCPF